MHGEHIKLVLASIAFSNDGVVAEHWNLARKAGTPLPIDISVQSLIESKPESEHEEPGDAADVWGDMAAGLHTSLIRRAIQQAKELDATMRSYAALDHVANVSGLNEIQGLFGPVSA